MRRKGQPNRQTRVGVGHPTSSCCSAGFVLLKETKQQTLNPGSGTGGTLKNTHEMVISRVSEVESSLPDVQSASELSPCGWMAFHRSGWTKAYDWLIKPPTNCRNIRGFRPGCPAAEDPGGCHPGGTWVSLEKNQPASQPASQPTNQESANGCPQAVERPQQGQQVLDQRQKLRVLGGLAGIWEGKGGLLIAGTTRALTLVCPVSLAFFFSLFNTKSQRLAVCGVRALRIRVWLSACHRHRSGCHKSQPPQVEHREADNMSCVRFVFFFATLGSVSNKSVGVYHLARCSPFNVPCQMRCLPIFTRSSSSALLLFLFWGMVLRKWTKKQLHKHRPQIAIPWLRTMTQHHHGSRGMLTT